MPETVTATIVDSAFEQAWDECVRTTPGATAWHVFRWSDLLERHYRLRCYHIAAFRGRHLCGLLPLYPVHTLKSGKLLVSIPYVVAGGIVAPTDEVRAVLLARAIELARKLGQRPIVLKQYGYKVPGDLRTDHGYYNLELALESDVDDHWAKLEALNRDRILWTRQLDLTLVYPSSDMRRFHDALVQHQRLTGVPCASLRWLRSLLDTGMYTIGLLEQGNRIVAGSLVKKFNGTLSFPLTCHAAGPDGDAFAYRLYWDLMRRSIAEGSRLFYSGRIRTGRPTEPYRLGWGGERCPYYYQYHGLSGPTPRTSRKGRGRRLFEAVWRRTPVTVARLVGPALMRQMP